MSTRHWMRALSTLVAAAAGVAAMAGAAGATDYIWFGLSGTDAYWTTDANWMKSDYTAGQAPTSADGAIFDNTGLGQKTVDLGAGIPVAAGLSFKNLAAGAAAGYNLSNGILTLGNGYGTTATITQSPIAAVAIYNTISGNLLVNADALDVTVQRGTLALTGRIGDDVSPVVLNATINSGTLILGNAEGATPNRIDASSRITVNSGGTLSVAMSRSGTSGLGDANITLNGGKLVFTLAGSPIGMIGINHEGVSPSYPASPVTQTAGLLPQGYWNNIAGTTGSLSALVDSDGHTTDVAVSWTTTLGTWATDGPTVTGNDQLMKGYLDSDTNGCSLTVTGLPEFLGEYDVYVYHESQGGDGRVGYYVLGDQTIWAKDRAGVFGTDHTDFVRDDFATQAEAEAGTGGNYVLFTGLTGTSFTVQGIGVTGTPRAPIQGIQIVPAEFRPAGPGDVGVTDALVMTPEPATLALMVLGGLALLRRRTR